MVNIGSVLAILKNPQFVQTLLLMIVLNVGINFYGLYYDYTKFFIIFGSALGFDALFFRFTRGEWKWPYSGINPGFGISLFLRTDILILYVLAAFIAISSKYLFRIKDRHFFNPSNFGAFAILVLFPQIAWINPLQWGKINDFNTLYFLIFCVIFAFGFFIIWRVFVGLKKNLLWLIIPYLITHIVLYMIFADNGSLISLARWFSPSFFIFMFFMLTDPVITPDNNWSKGWFAINTAILIYVLQFFINENYATLASLFIMTMTLPGARYLDTYTIYKKCTGGNLFYIMIFLLLLIGLLLCIQILGPIDLVFDNRCRELFCM